MKRKTKFVLTVGLCFFSAVLLSRLAQMLDVIKHPLVSSLTCIETSNPADLYWSINQIALTGSVLADEQKVVLILRNNIPNFECYFFRIDGDTQWRTSKDGIIVVETGSAPHSIEVRAMNALGGELPATVYTVDIRDNAVTVMPCQGGLESIKYGFRFEKPGSEKMAWLKQQVMPVIRGCTDQWNAYMVLRTWVSRQIPNAYPVMKSHWDAQRILKAVRNHDAVGFHCDAHAATYVSACASAGLNARMIHLGDDNNNGHYVTEVWSDDHKKWILMDPLYDCHFSLSGIPLSALELHNVWKEGRIKEIAIQGRDGVTVSEKVAEKGYMNLFQDIQLVNANDFLSMPLSSVLDLLTFKIRFVRYIDDVNPPYNRIKLASQLLLFYYLPMIISGFIIPFVIPAFLIFMTLNLGKNKT